MSTSIFTFDHGQKQLNKAIGVTEEYLEELAEKCATTVKSCIFDEHNKPRTDMSPSNLVEKCVNEFSYSQLVVLAGFYLNDKLDKAVERMEKRVSDIKIGMMDSETMPPELKKLLDDFISKIKEENDDDDDDDI